MLQKDLTQKAELERRYPLFIREKADEFETYMVDISEKYEKILPPR